ncbi:MAG: WG repeat-containing protein [Flavobacteriales bacterium]
MKSLFITWCVISMTPLMLQAQYSKKDDATGLYGYVNTDGTWLIAPQYDDAWAIAYGLGKVKKGEYWGYINAKGQSVIPVEFLKVGSVSEDLIAITNKENKTGYYNVRGQKVIDFIYDQGCDFYSGMAAVKSNQKWGFINNTGKLLIAHLYDENVTESDWDDWSGWASELDFGYSFSGDYAIVKLQGKKGLINKTGKVLIDFVYDQIEAGHTGNYIARKCDVNGENCTYGIINQNGAALLPFQYSHITTGFDCFKIYQGTEVDYLFGEITGGVMGFADMTGKVIAPCIYDNTDDNLYAYVFDGIYTDRYYRAGFHNGYYHAAKGGMWGYIDAQGKEVIPFQFESASSFARDSAVVSMNGYTFYINTKGQCIKDCPDEMNMTTAAASADQTKTLNDLVDKFMDFVMNELPLMAGEAADLKTVEVYSSIQIPLDRVIAYGTDDQKKQAKYLKFITTVMLAEIRGEKSVSEAVTTLRPVRYIADSYSSYDFPIYIYHDGQQRHYDYSHFQEEFKIFYTLLAECEYKMNDPLAEPDLKKAIPLCEGTRNKALLTAFLIDFKQEQGTYDQEMLDYSNQLLASYAASTVSNREWLDSLEMWTGNQPAAIEAAFTSRTGSNAPNNFYSTAYPIYREMGDHTNADYFMEKLYKQGHDEYNFLWSMAELASDKGDKNTAEKVATSLQIKTAADDCYNLQRLSELYLKLNNTAEAKAVKKQADECANKNQKQAEKEGKESKKREKNYNSPYDVNRGLYLGIDVFPLLSTVKGHRDFGFCMDIVGSRGAHEFYYEKINANKDHMMDVNTNDGETDGYDLRWNGYNAHYAYKAFTESNRTSPYVGFLLRYRNKTFDTVYSSLLDENGFQIGGVEAYQPTEQQFEFFLNYGVMTTRRGIACDMYFGFGPKYSRFDHHIADYKSSGVYSHSLLEYRNEQRWGLGVRIGITVGIKI